MMLRLAMIGVLVALAISVVLEILNAAGCVQPSISAYYYTPSRAVFVSALVTIGTCMIVLWGRNKWEDAFLNIAGLLAPVVAFVPTSDVNYCSVVTSRNVDLTDRAERSDAAARTAQAQVDTLVTATHQAIDNNVKTLGIVVALSLAALLYLALKRDSKLIPRVSNAPRWISDPGFYFPWGVSLLVLVVGAFTYTAYKDEFYANAHEVAAVVLFIFIILVVATNAYLQWKASKDPTSVAAEMTPREPHEYRAWALRYGLVVALMVGGVILIVAIRLVAPDTWFGEHWILILEATLIFLFAVFWLLQTADRRNEGAPKGQPWTPKHASKV
jgi:hypothetical protein